VLRETANRPGTNREVRQFHPVVTIKQTFARNDVQFFPEMSRNQVEGLENEQ
jgi:hypothetical protein